MRLLPPHNEHGWTTYVWLIYLTPYLFLQFLVPSPLRSPTLGWIVWAVGLVAFLGLYFRSHWVDGKRRRPFILGLAALGGVLGMMNPGALLFFTYASALVGGAVKAAHAGYWIGGLTVAGILASLVAPGPPVWLVPGVAVMTPVIGFVNLHYVETRRRDASLKLAQEEIARLATIAERERIAGDLHDLLGHTLSVIILKSELAAKLVAREPERAAAEIAEVERVSRTALTEVRRAVQGFRTTSLDDELMRARAVLETAGVQVSVDAVVTEGVSRGVEHAAAMIVREAVTNVVRHARATHCRISARAREGQLVVQVEDDGVGGRVIEGVGIEGMRARAREVGGILEHRSERGVVVTLRVPTAAGA